MKIKNLRIIIIFSVWLLLIISFGNVITGPHFAQAYKFDLSTAPLTAAQAQVLPDVQISVGEVIASGFEMPADLTHAGDGSGRLFVVEKTGKIKVIKNGQVLAQPFLDVSSKIALGFLEQGLLGLAFHPDFTTNDYFYINYTRISDGANVIARYSLSTSDPDRGDETSESIVMVIPQPYGYHNAGKLIFGPDGFLYLGVADGGPQKDLDNNGQNINTLLGSILRIDVHDGTLPYKIPADNPFVDKDGLDEIWAHGFRNPWRFSFDRLNDDLYIGDVGNNEWEEVDFQPSGSPGGYNFGWRCKEGSHNFNYADACPDSLLTDPIAEYPHNGEDKAVVGGFVYRGSEFPNLAGRYFYADWVTGAIWSLYKVSSDPLVWSVPELELDTDYQISSFGEDEDGELYIVDFSGGTIHRLADASATGPVLSASKKSASTPSADPNEAVTYTISISNTGVVTNSLISLSDNIPAGLEYITKSLHASHGTPDDTTLPLLTWQGNLEDSPQMTITYQVRVTGIVTGSIINEAQLTGPEIPTTSLAASINVPRSKLNTTKDDFFFPGTQPENLNQPIVQATNCNACHTEPVYDRWRGSIKSNAGRDPLFWSALHIANVDAPNAGEYCLRCHTPKGWLEGRSHPPDGSAMLSGDKAYGVSCSICHRLVDPNPSSGDEASSIDAGIRSALQFPVPAGYVGSGAMTIDPDDNRRGPFSFNLNHPYHTAYQTDFLGQTSDAVTRSRMCGTCHNVQNPVLSWNESRLQFWPNGSGAPAPEFDNTKLFPVETTFDEWLNSDFAINGVFAPQFAGEKTDGIVSACQDCHMPRITGYAAEQGLDGVLLRDCQDSGCLPEHAFVGANAWLPELLQDPNWRLSADEERYYLDKTIDLAKEMLTKAAEISVELRDHNLYRSAEVKVVNKSGHKLPTGYPEGRQIWINLKAFNASDALIYQSGAYNSNTGKLVRDPDLKVYEIKQGITPELAESLSLPAGESFHFVLNNTVIKDNRIPPQGFTNALFDRPGLNPVGVTYADGQNWDTTTYYLPIEAERVEVVLYYQTSSREYIDFLRKFGGVDGNSLGSLWEKSKSPPVVMAQVNKNEWKLFNFNSIFPIIPRD